MLKLTLDDIRQIATHAMDASHAATALERAPVEDATTYVQGFAVAVPREVLVAAIRARLNSALDGLRALGIDLQPDGLVHRGEVAVAASGALNFGGAPDVRCSADLAREVATGIQRAVSRHA